MKNNINLAPLLLSGLALMTIIVASALVQAQVTVTSTGTIKAVGLNFYSDSQATQPLTTINWGMAAPGDTVNRQAYMKSTSNVPCTVAMSTKEWNPTEAGTYLTCTWDSSGQIQPNEVIKVTFTLAISPNTNTFRSYSFSIVVVATEK